MEIYSTRPSRIVFDYDFVFIHGVALPLTIDPNLGDKIDFEDPNVVTVHLVAKTSPLTSGQNLPAEEVTIFKDKIISIQRRQREIFPLTPEQELELEQTYQLSPSKKTH